MQTLPNYYKRFNPDLFVALPIDEIIIFRSPVVLALTIEALLFILVINLPYLLRIRFIQYFR